MSEKLDNLVSEWRRLGIAFDAEPSFYSPEPESLLIATLPWMPGMSRLFDLSATWLHRYGELVSRHRLATLATALPPADQAALGLLLETAQQDSHPPRFAAVLKRLSPLTPPRPLFDVERTSQGMIDRCEGRASEISKRWGVWCEPFPFQDRKLYSPQQVLEMNPGLRTRLDLKGDLRVAVLAALQHDPGSGESEAALARAAGGSRSQTRAALDNLELSGRVRRVKVPGKRGVRIELIDAA